MRCIAGHLLRSCAGDEHPPFQIGGPWGIGAVALPRLVLEQDGTLRFSDPMRMHYQLEGARFRLPRGTTPSTIAAVLDRYQKGQTDSAVILEPVRSQGAYGWPPRVRITRDGVEVESGAPSERVPMVYLFDHQLRPVAYTDNPQAPLGKWLAEFTWSGPGPGQLQLAYPGLASIQLDYGGTALVQAQQAVNAAGVVLWSSKQSYDEHGRLKSQEMSTRRYGADAPLEPRRRVDIRYYQGAAGPVESVDYNGKTELHLGFDDAGAPSWLMLPGRCVLFISQIEEDGSYRLALSERVAEGASSCLSSDDVSRSGSVYLRPRQ